MVVVLFIRRCTTRWRFNCSCQHLSKRLT